jgi:DNA-binding transcriptional ArsR family regulator
MQACSGGCTAGRWSAYQNGRRHANPLGPNAKVLASLRKLLYIRRVLDVSDLDTARQRSAVVARALADPKRLCVLQSLAAGELSVRDLSDRVGCNVPNMSQHLAVLRNSGLVLTRRDGNAIYYRLADPRILEACQLLQSIAG